MGMYDTLNGEQVKAFQWYSFDASDKRIGSAIVGHGGNLAYYSSKKHKDEYENWKKKYVRDRFRRHGKDWQHAEENRR